MSIILLLVGLALIIKSADVLVDAASKIARRFGVSSFVIGITVVAFGTSAPELVVGLLSAVQKTNQLTLGNIVGSAFSNSALNIGLAAVIFPLFVKDSVVKREIPMLLLVQGALSFMVLSDGVLSRWDGVLLLIGFAGFLAYVIFDSKKALQNKAIEGDLYAHTTTPSAEAGKEDAKKADAAKLWIAGALSLVGLFIGGKLAVDSSTKIAVAFGLSETVIGLTVVALATTLPELTASLMAVRRKEPEIVLGNCIGSNLFNILLILGTSSVIHPISVQGNMLFDMLFMLFLTLLVFFVALFKKRIPRFVGVLLMLLYLGYIAFQVINALA